MRADTSKLSGAALDWAVAKCEGKEAARVRGLGGAVRLFKTVGYDPTPWQPSTDWAQGGPIIEREKISIELCFSGSYCEGSFATPTGWKAAKYKRGGALNEPAFCGHTPLIAAMRCYVASKLGREVEIPDELA